MPTIAVGSPADTMASGAPRRETPPSGAARIRERRGRASGRGPAAVFLVRRRRASATRRPREPGRTHEHSTSIPGPNSGSLPESRALTAAPSDPTVPARGQAPVAPKALESAVAADALPPAPWPAGNSTPPCYPGELNC
jgi:hypothetical protein